MFTSDNMNQHQHKSPSWTKICCCLYAICAKF